MRRRYVNEIARYRMRAKLHGIGWQTELNGIGLQTEPYGTGMRTRMHGIRHENVVVPHRYANGTAQFA